MQTIQQVMKPTKHKYDCQMAFGRKDPSCPRCQELISGMKPRDGWQKSYFESKARNEAIQLAAIRAHDCKKAGCLPVCTFGDY
jgi:hypothetical protein